MRLLVLVLLVAGLAALGGVVPAHATIFTTTSTLDEPDANPGDGECRTTAATCTLRAALQEANALPGPHAIALAAGPIYTLTRVGPGDDAGDLDIRTSLVCLCGFGYVVRGATGWDDRIFDVWRGASVELRELRIENGHSPDSFGTAVMNDGTLSLVASTLSGNSGPGPPILNREHGTLSVLNTTIRDNNSTQVGGEVSGGLANREGGTVTLAFRSMITGNSAAGNGGGITNSGNLTVTDSTITGNSAGADGGGISTPAGLAAPNSTITVTNSTISGNSAGLDGGGIQIWGGTLTLTGSTVSGNIASAGRGGGIAVPEGSYRSVTLLNSTVSGNSAVNGGGIFGTYATLTVTASTISGNNAALDGGGMYLTPTQSVPTSLGLVNSTISGNSAARSGGGLWSNATASANNVTIAGNVADGDADGAGDGGGIFRAAGPLTIANTIVGDNVDRSASATFPDCRGSVISQGYNLIETGTGCTISGTATGNITGWDPGLGPLGNNGGPTFTHALVTRFGTPSPAVDAGNPGVNGTFCAGADQRSVSRPINGDGDRSVRCDIGAYEAPLSLRLGTFALAPSKRRVRPGRHVTYTLAWTVPPPRGWRTLDTLQLRFSDRKRTALWVRFDEVPGSPGGFRLVDPRNGHLGPRFAPGSRARLETRYATLYLADSRVEGPPGQRVTLKLAVSFKPRAAGRRYGALVLATDDQGNVQGFNGGGTLSVRRTGCVVPEVIGQRLATARTRIRQAHCRVGRIRHARASRAGRVISQRPKPGTSLRRGGRVSLVVGHR